MKKFNKAITKIRNLKNYDKEYDIIAKIISLTYLTTVSENILYDKNNKKPEKEIIILIKKTLIDESFSRYEGAFCCPTQIN